MILLASTDHLRLACAGVARSAIVTLLLALTSVGAATAESSTPPEYSILADYRFNKASKRTRLSKELREISGLVALPGATVALHTDNTAVVWVFDYNASTLATTLLVDQPIRGDFEGIARHGQFLWLADSHGSLSRFPLAQGSDKAVTKPAARQLFHPAFKERCVFEGLAVSADSSTATMLLPCKYPRFAEAGHPAANDSLIYIFRQHLTPANTVDIDAGFDVLTIDVSSVLKARRLPRLRPSAIERVDDHLLILAGKERVLLETTLAGDLVAWRRLAWPRHRQAEGLAMGTDGSLVIADEGRWLGGTVTLYQPNTARTAR